MENEVGDTSCLKSPIFLHAHDQGRTFFRLNRKHACSLEQVGVV